MPERKQSHIYPSRSLKKVAISFDHDPILFSAFQILFKSKLRAR
jgi:hypothetical protein